MLMLTVDQTTTLRISPKDSHGNVSTLESVPVWTSSDENVLTLTVSEDGLTCGVDVTGVIGNAQVNVSADVKPGDEVKTLTGSLDVSIVAGETAVIDVVADAPTATV